MIRFLAALWSIILDTAPYVLVGMVLSGLVHEVLSRRRELSEFAGRRGFWSLTGFTLFGFALPICSCGVAPMAVGLRRGHRVPAGNVFAFLFSAPATSVTALVLASAALGWRFTLFYMAGGLVCGYAIGAVFYALESRDPNLALGGRALPMADTDRPESGGLLTRALEWGLGVYGSRIAFDQIIGLSLCAIVITVLSVPDLSWWLNRQPYPLAAAAMVVTALPLYVCSIPAILMAGAFVAGGLRPELAWIFLMAGPVTNLGDMNVLRRQVGPRATAIYAALVIVLVVAWGLVIRGWLDPAAPALSADAYFVDRSMPVDICALPLDGVGQSPALDFWEVFKHFSAPVYLLLILIGALAAAREFLANPCLHCRHYQHDLSIHVASCTRPCWKRSIWPLAGRFAPSRAVAGNGPAGFFEPTVMDAGSIRRLLLSAGLAGLVGVVLYLTVSVDAPAPPLRPTPGYLQAIRGYTPEFSFLPEDAVELFFAGGPAHDGQRVTSVTVYDAVTGSEVLTRDSLDLPVPVTPCRSFRDEGCAFPGRVLLASGGWKPGAYRAVLRTNAGTEGEPVFFHIRPSPGTDRPPIALMYPSFTWQAYNADGGLSYYGRGLEPEFAVASRLRPLPPGTLNSPATALLFTRFLHENGLRFTTFDNLDLHRDPRILDGVELLIIAVHDEYWTEEMRRHVEAFLARGGKLLVAGGNTCWWKVRLEGPNIVVNKHNRDPEPDPHLRTGLWRNEIIGDPEEKTFGLTWEGGGYPIHRQFPKFADVPAEYKLGMDWYRASAGMRVLTPGHPVFAGTGLKEGDTFGVGLPLMDWEIDGLPIRKNGAPAYDIFPQAPRNLTPLAYSLAWNPIGRLIVRPAVMVEFLYRGRGRVMNLGSIGWYHGLEKDHPVTKRILRNAVDYLLAAPVPAPPDNQ